GADPAQVRLARGCLAAAPEERPRDAGGVAEAVTAYQASVEERLRKAEGEQAQAQVKSGEERKRRRLRLPLAAATMAVLALVLGSGDLWRRQRAARDRAFDADLDRAAELRDGSRWDEAAGSLRQAEDRLGAGETKGQRQRLGRARADLGLAFRP